MHPSDKVRYGIIGFGLFAERFIARAIRASPNSEIRAIQKRSLPLAKEKAQLFNIPLAFDSPRALVDHPDVDAVFILSANCCHATEAIAAARAGKHVLVEKPMATTVVEAEAMTKACKENRVQLMVAHMVRLSPLIIRMKELIQSGSIGRAKLVKSEFIYDGKRSHRSWLLERKVAGGGPIFDVGVHCLDTTRFLLDDEVVSAKSQLDPVPTDTVTESTAHLNLKFSRGTIASIVCSYTAPIRRTSIEVIGDEGILAAESFSLSEETLTLKITFGKEDRIFASNEEKIPVPNLYEKEVTLFSESILNHTASPIPGEEGVINQRVLEQAISVC